MLNNIVDPKEITSNQCFPYKMMIEMISPEDKVNNINNETPYDGSDHKVAYQYLAIGVQACP